MVEKLITSPRNVIDLARYQQGRVVGKAQAFSTRLCRHCGAALADGENEDEVLEHVQCRSRLPLRDGAAQSLRGVKAAPSTSRAGQDAQVASRAQSRRSQPRADGGYRFALPILRDADRQTPR